MATPFDEESLLIAALQGQRTICSKEEALLLSKIGRLVCCSSGEIIAKEGAIGNEAYYILSGSVQINIKGHKYKVRRKNELIGEMSIIEPGGRRSADLLANEDDTYLFAVDAADFHKLASSNCDLWRCIAVELADRLRQRDGMFLPPNEVPTVFVASSSEGAGRYLDIIKAQLAGLDRPLKPWNQRGIFQPSRSTLQALEKQANESDFAVVLVTADDIQESRGQINSVARDNVIFEAGLFMGSLEAERVFLLVENIPDLKMPSDLKGITVMTFSDENDLKENLNEIADYIDKIGLMFRYCHPFV
jgi:predicted nucleotide-binding protein